MEKIIQKIEEKLGIPDLVTQMDEKLSNSEINSLLMELFSRKAARMQPAELLRQFSQNRFCTPSPLQTIPLKQYEIEWLTHVQQSGFHPVTLSPLAPLGNCSAMGPVHQNKVVSALRGTEVVADATNMLALIIAAAFQKGNKGIRKYAATHRHVRGQYFTNPAFTAHFSVCCMATGGQDQGHFSFECRQLVEHITTYTDFLAREFENDDLVIKLYLKDHQRVFHEKLDSCIQPFKNCYQVDIVHESGNAYYQLLQFKVFLKHKGNSIDLADGGFVDWTQQLLQNKKQRLLISGVGIELIFKIKNGYL